MGIPEPASALTRLARQASGHPEDVVRRVLVLACELLGMDLAYVTRLDLEAVPASRTVVMAVSRDGSDVAEGIGLTEPLEQSWCGLIVRKGAALIADVKDHPDLAVLPSTSAFGIASHAGVVITSPSSPAGEVLGTLCVLGRHPHATLNDRDAAVLHDLAAVIPQLITLVGHAPLPSPRLAPDLLGLASSVLTGDGLEGLTRPLLEALQVLTRLGSTYLTQIHPAPQKQEVLYALNTRSGFEIPEGVLVPWTDTLCKRALDEGRVFTTDVPEIWSDSQAAAALGIQVYASVPVELDDGTIWGTLCAADSHLAEEVDQHLPTMRLFSRLIAADVQRTEHVNRSVRSAERAVLIADTDPLTGCAQRRLIEPWLTNALSLVAPEEEVVVAFLDVDHFKHINDTFGHTAGDSVLVEVARRLRRAMRSGDLLARYAGDEFLIAAVASTEGMSELARRLHDVERFSTVVDGHTLNIGVSVGIVSEAGTEAERCSAHELLERADQAMYRLKRSRGRR